MVQHGWMREQLFDTLRALSDVEYQRRAWVNHIFPPGVEHDSLDVAVHFLFDDTSLADSPEQNVGWTLENDDEVRAIRKVTQAIDAVLDKLGADLTDEEYINSPDWNRVVKAASEALAVLNKNPVK